MRKIAAYVLYGLIFCIGFWVFSRFTVDDAFITWRYGKNFVDFGFWAYNPTHFDLTQAYTNPLYAFLSIVPAYLKFDTVLFFKLVSLINLVIFTKYLFRYFKNNLLVYFLIVMPATIIHCFAGLETFLFVSVLTFAFISIYKEQLKQSSFALILLNLVRPEAWLLTVLFSAFEIGRYYLQYKILDKGRSTENLKMNVATLFMPILTLFIYLALNWLYFDDILPNTFYIKSGGMFSLRRLEEYLLYIGPLLIALVVIGRRERLIYICLFLLVLSVKYASSDLTMNYANRFGYHLVFPSLILSCYILSDVSNYEGTSEGIIGKNIVQFTMKLAMFLALLLYTYRSINTRDDLLHLANYYPRILNCHSALGKLLTSEEFADLDSYSFGDAGLLGFHSGKIQLDNIGLASRSIGRIGGLNRELIHDYFPEIVVFHSSGDKGLRLSEYNQEELFKFVKEQNFVLLGELIWEPKYTLTIYAINRHAGITELIEESNPRNDKSNVSYFFEHIHQCPLTYWRE